MASATTEVAERVWLRDPNRVVPFRIANEGSEARHLTGADFDTESIQVVGDEVWIGDERATLTKGQLTVVPAGRKHGFSNTGTSVLHIQSTLASPVFEAAYDDKRETPRRYLPG